MWCLEAARKAQTLQDRCADAEVAGNWRMGPGRKEEEDEHGEREKERSKELEVEEEAEALERACGSYCG